MIKFNESFFLKLRTVLIQSDYFKSDRQLGTLFVDSSIRPWRAGLSKSNTVEERVDSLIDYLSGKYSKPKNQNVLILFLEVLVKKIPSEDYSATQLSELINQLEPINVGKHSDQIVENKVQFTNRVDEKDTILSINAPAYFILDAPAGYGKSELLGELVNTFGRRKWYCYQLTLDLLDDENSLISMLASQLEKTQKRDISTIEEFGKALRNEWVEETTSKGLVWSIDFVGKPNLPLLKWLLVTFIPEIQKILDSLKFFKEVANRFRVLIAGRYLATHLSIEPPYQVKKLSPFKYNIFKDATKKFLSNGYDEQLIDELSAHLFFHTGGHPGCMNDILKIYKLEGIPLDFSENVRSELWSQVVKKYADEAFNDFLNSSPTLDSTLNQLVVLRYVNPWILEKICPEEDPTMLADHLTKTFLFRWTEHRVLQDDITRRMLTIRLRNIESERFQNHCQQAKHICVDLLNQPIRHSPQIWVLEYLFQYLNAQTLEIYDAKSRDHIREDFFNKEVEFVLKLLVQNLKKDSRQWYEEKTALFHAMKKDWELIFTINYYLRFKDDTSQPTPYELLEKCVNDFFA